MFPLMAARCVSGVRVGSLGTDATRCALYRTLGLALGNQGVAEPLFSSPYSPRYLMTGAWSPTRPGLIMVARNDGVLQAWDLLGRNSASPSDSGPHQHRASGCSRALACRFAVACSTRTD
jgi:hypothetical protein